MMLQIAKRVAVWYPAVFCAFLSSMMMFGDKDAAWPAFYAFLPMCFLFVGSVMHQLKKRVDELERQLAKSRQDAASHADA